MEGVLREPLTNKWAQKKAFIRKNNRSVEFAYAY